MSRSSSVNVASNIPIVLIKTDKDTNDVTDMPSVGSLTTPPPPPPQVATSSPHSRITENSDSAPDTPDSSTTCSWCGRPGGTWEPGSSLSCTGGITSNTGRFCSEACFAAGRRAAFKRARTCDWCRHLRHSVSYVDFQDGENQLQFCSDKCLNQYKMNIFCRETQAYLALHGLTSVSPTSNQSIRDGLITPELWLRDCQSPQSSSLEDEALVVDDEPMNWSSDCALENEDKETYQVDRSALHNSTHNSSVDDLSKSIKNEDKYSENSSVHDYHEETIKLAINESLKDEEHRRCMQRKEEMDSFKSFSACVESRIPIRNSATINNNNNNNNNNNININNSATIKTCRRSKSSPETLNASSPHRDVARKGTIFIKDVRKLLRRDPEKERNSIQSAQYRIPTNNIIATAGAHNSAAATSKLPISFSRQPQMTVQYLKDFSSSHLPFIQPHQMPVRFSSHPTNYQSIPLSSPNINIERPRPSIPSYHTSTPQMNHQPSSLVPPVTVLVPYPIPIPIPLPIPIPMPIFEKFFRSKTTVEKENDASTSAEASSVPQDLSQRSKLKHVQLSNSPKLNVTTKKDKISILSESSTSSSASASPALIISQSSFRTLVTDSPKPTSILPILPFTSTKNINKTRTLRKRKHLQSESHDEIDLSIKRKSKFVSV